MTKLQRILGLTGIKFIRFWVKLFGKSVLIKNNLWLEGPIGEDGEIGRTAYEDIAKKENLIINKDPEGALIKDFNVLDSPSFKVGNCDPKVRHFYENTAQYKLDAWSETRFPGRLFLWVIVTFVSRYMNQLNFPIFGLDMSKGMSSEILSLQDNNGKTIYTGWFRSIKKSKKVIYTGFYSSIKPPKLDSNCVKVVFPLPKGNASVFLRPTYNDKNQFELLSSGNQFGDSGFYRVVGLNKNQYKVLYLKSLKERFTVYSEHDGVLRCDHSVHFLGMLMIKLNYRMYIENQD